MAYLNKSVPNFPREHARILNLVVVNPLLDVRRGHLGLGAADDAGPDGSCFLVAVKDFGDAAVGDAKLPGDDAGPHAGRRHLHDLEADVVG